MFKELKETMLKEAKEALTTVSSNKKTKYKKRNNWKFIS